MQGSGLVLLTILLLLLLNVLMVVATFAVKGLRNLERNRVQRLRERIEPGLYDYLVTREVSPDLRLTKGRDLNVLSNMIIELLVVLRGSEGQRMAELAGELGLVERDLDRLGSRGRWWRTKAAENLGYYGGPEAVGPISALFRGRDETVRAVAARALSRIGTKEAAETLADYLNSDSELTSLRMAENLERMGPLATNALVRLVDSEEEGERRAQVLAARVLGNLRIAEARGALRRSILRHRHTNLRAQATLALGKIGDLDDISIIVEATSDNSWPVRTQAANALGMIGDVSTVPTLEDLAKDQEWWVRLNACKALVKIGPEGERALVRILESPDRFARDRAAATLESQGIIRRLAGELAKNNDQSEYAGRVIRALARTRNTRHLNRLSRTLPERQERRALRRVLDEAEAEIETEAKAEADAKAGTGVGIEADIDDA